MSSRKSSASCTKGTSFESNGSGDAESYQDVNVLKPNRQSVRPPAADRQRSEGFAKFLKTHSSPTHNRVTAGGRIVPMEPKSPPRFALSPSSYRSQYEPAAHAHSHQRIKENTQDSNNASVHQENSRFQMNGVPDRTLYARPEGPSDQQGYMIQHQFAHSATPYIPQSQSFVNPTQGVVSPMHNGIAQVQGLSDYHYDPQWPSVQPESHDSAYWYNTNNGHTPWSFNATQQLSGGGVLGTMSAPEILQAWEQHYSDLDQQLKDIDRHRALSTPSNALVAQRRVIAQQRSDAKDTINEYRTMLGMYHEHTSSHKSPSPRFNIDAPAYVPAAYTHSSHAQSQSLNQDFQVEEALAATKSRAPWSLTRRPLEIRAPPARHETGMKSITMSRERAEVDEWGVRRAEAPPEIRRQQSKMSEMLDEERKQSTSTEASPFSQARESGLTAVHRSSSGQDWDESVMISSHGDKVQEHVPLDVVDEQRRIVKAINMPKGTVSYVRLLDNRVVSVHGQGLNLGMEFMTSTIGTQARVPSAGHSPQELQVRTDAPASQSSSSDGVDVGKENVPTGTSIHQKAATDAFLSQFSTLEAISRKSVPTTQSLHTRHSTSRDDAPFPPYVQSRTANLFQDRSSNVPRPPPERPSHHVSNQPRVHNDHTYAFEDGDDLLTKGYSSVSVQNVHATGRVPQGFDGSIDSGRTALSQVAAADRVKSPRLARRAFGKGAGWYGPYCRALIPGSTQRSTR